VVKVRILEPSNTKISCTVGYGPTKKYLYLKTVSGHWVFIFIQRRKNLG